MSLNFAKFSRLFQDTGPISELPSFGVANTYEPGHLFVDRATGTRYQNIGHKNYSMHVGWPNRYELVERFMQLPGINANAAAPAADTYNTAQMDLALLKSRNFEVLGTNATSSTVAFADGGGVLLTTTTTTNDQVILAPHLDTGISSWAAAKWNTLDEISYDVLIKVGGSVADIMMWGGFKLTNTSTLATDDDQAFFRFDTVSSDTTWRCITSRAGTDVNVSSGVTVAINTAYHLRIVVDGDRKPRFYINGSEVGVSSTGNAALTSDIDLKPYIGVQTCTGGAKSMYVRGIACGKTYND